VAAPRFGPAHWANDTTALSRISANLERMCIAGHDKNEKNWLSQF